MIFTLTLRSGTVKKAFVQDGTYFSEPLFEGVGDPNVVDIDAGGIAVGQGFLTALATRAVIFIQADNPAIGLMAFIGVGMDEVWCKRSLDPEISCDEYLRRTLTNAPLGMQVSTCDITVKEVRS